MRTEHLPINLLTYKVLRCTHTALTAQRERPNISPGPGSTQPAAHPGALPGHGRGTAASSAASPRAPRCGVEPRARPGPRSPGSEQPRGSRSALSSPAAAGDALRAAGAAPAAPLRPRRRDPRERPRAPLAPHGTSRPRDRRGATRGCAPGSAGIRRDLRPDFHPRGEGDPGERCRAAAAPRNLPWVCTATF